MTTLVKKNLTLTRWHKVAERLTAEMKRLSVACDTKLNQMNLSFAARGTIKPSLIENASSEVRKMIAEHAELNDALTTIRASLATANATTGVSALLAKSEGLNRRAQMLSSLHNIEAAKILTFDDYQNMEAVAQSADALGRVTSGGASVVKVKILPSEYVSEMEQTIQSIRREIPALADQISDLNRATLAIELPTNALKVAGIERE